MGGTGRLPAGGVAVNPVTTRMLRDAWEQDPHMSEATLRALRRLTDAEVEQAIGEALWAHRAAVLGDATESLTRKMRRDWERRTVEAAGFTLATHMAKFDGTVLPRWDGAGDKEEVMDKTYMIVRLYQDPDRDSEVLERGLTRAAAQAHCKDPETSSSTASSPEGLTRTEKYGPWFDGFEEE